MGNGGKTMLDDSEQSSNAVAICSAEECKPGQRITVEIDGLEIAIVNSEGKLYAFQNKCPHQGVSLAFGAFGGMMLPSEPGEFIYGCDNEIMRCPLHGWEFDMNTGKSVFDPGRVAIKTYRIQEVDGSIVLSLKRACNNVKVIRLPCSPSLK